MGTKMGTRGGRGREDGMVRKDKINIYTMHIKINPGWLLLTNNVNSEREGAGGREGEREIRGELYHTPDCERLIIASKALVTGKWYHQGFRRNMVVTAFVHACIG